MASSRRTGQSRTPRRVGLHCCRIVLLAAIVLMIRQSHRRALERQANADAKRIPVADVAAILPESTTLSDPEGSHGIQRALDGDASETGFAVQTSPHGDRIIGFSGPTNVLIAFGADERIAGIRILDSGDTREHVQQVLDDETFMTSFDELTWDEAATSRVDAVSGATLTSLAIVQAIQQRLGGGSPSLKFPDGINLQQVSGLFPIATELRQDDSHAALWHVLDEGGSEIGTILRTSPAADNIIGYQGPTDTLIGLSPGGQVMGIAVGGSYDNEPYVGYVRDEKYFLELFNDHTLQALADLDLEESPVEGVSGATMTSQSMTEGLVVAARQHLQSLERVSAAEAEHAIRIAPRDFGTGAVIAAAIVIGFTRLRGQKWVRIPFQLLLIIYVGLINGDLLSQAMFVGWAQSGVPLASAISLILLTLAAVLVPVTTRVNLYCSHVCPHGAAQQLLVRRLPWQIRLSPRARRILSAIPGALLLWVILVAMLRPSFSLVDIEPFDAYVWHIAGWAAITIAVVGLVASLFVPMAYCRYGCPTGAMLGFLRFNARSDRLSGRDLVAIGLLVVAVAVNMVT